MKIVSCMLVASLSLSIGCYNYETITREELKARVEQDDITVHTNQSMTYDFLKGNYRVQGDSLLGVQIIGDSFISKRVDASLSFTDITSIETKQFSAGKGIGYIFAGLGLVILIALIAQGGYHGG